MFVLDVGLLCAMGDLSQRTLLDGNRIFEEHKGSMTEQFVAQELKADKRDLYYYSA